MKIAVCIKRVPDLTEAEIEIAAGGRALEDSDLDYDINEWDDYAIEEAVAIKEQHGGSVTAYTIGDEDAEEVLRRALAMGADEAVHLTGAAFEEGDPFAVASALKAAVGDKGYDLILCGAISSDGSSAHTAGMLAAMLDQPQVALVTKLELKQGKLEVQHEVEDGLERVVEIDLPCVLSVQSGINEPRYVSIRGIKKVADLEIPALDESALGLDAKQVGAAGSRIRLESLALPPSGERAEILEGSLDETVSALVERMREKGVL